MSLFDNLNVQIAGGLDIPLPPMMDVKQTFVRQPIVDLETAVITQINSPNIAATIKPGASIAIGGGQPGCGQSRGDHPRYCKSN